MTLQLISNLKLLWRLMVSVSSQGWCDVRTSEREQEMVSATMSKTTVQAWRAGVLLPQTLTNTTETVFYSRFGLFMFSGSVSDGEMSCLLAGLGVHQSFTMDYRCTEISGMQIQNAAATNEWAECFYISSYKMYSMHPSGSWYVCLIDQGIFIFIFLKYSRDK